MFTPQKRIKKDTSKSWHVGMLAINTGVLEIGDTKSGRRLATLNAMDYTGHTDELVTNAHLMAAAPQLLEACKEILNYHERGVKRNEPVLSNHFLKIIKQAVQKVEN